MPVCYRIYPITLAIVVLMFFLCQWYAHRGPVGDLAWFSGVQIPVLCGHQAGCSSPWILGWILGEYCVATVTKQAVAAHGSWAGSWVSTALIIYYVSNYI